MTAPQEHIDEAKKLTQDSLVNLFEIRLHGTSTILRIKDFEPLRWQGVYWNGNIPISLKGATRSADTAEVRPTLSIMDIHKLFAASVFDGSIDYSVVVRKRVLYQNLLDDVNIYEQRMWYIARCTQMIAGQAMTFELRNMTEGPAFMIPVRQFNPPEFPLVSLG